MRSLLILLFPTLVFSQKAEFEVLPDAIPHIYSVSFKKSEVLIGPDGDPVGFIEGVETIESNYQPPLPDRIKVTRIEYGLDPSTADQAFIITDSKEIDLIYRIFGRFSSKRTIQRKHYRLTKDQKIEEVDLGKLTRWSMHLCTNAYHFYAKDELLIEIESHPNDEAFFGNGFRFYNHPMVAFIKHKIERVNKATLTTPVAAPPPPELGEMNH